LEHSPQQHASLHAFGGSVRGSRAVSTPLIQQLRLIMKGHWDRRQPHDRAIASCARICTATEGFAGSAEMLQGTANGVAYIEAAAIAAHVAPLLPVAVATHLIGGVKTADL
jgi:hypothetical protein